MEIRKVKGLKEGEKEGRGNIAPPFHKFFDPTLHIAIYRRSRQINGWSILHSHCPRHQVCSTCCLFV